MKLVFLLPLVTGLSVLLSSTDSWVSKNSRYLYRALVAEGHKVVYIGPLYSLGEHLPLEDIEMKDIKKERKNTVFKFALEGGDFGHLLPAHQKYYKYIRKLKTLAHGARKVISKNDSDEFDLKFDSESIVRTKVLGQDPLNHNFWYVDGAPLECLSVAFSEILPKYLPDFFPDLVIVGPNEGLHLSTSTVKGESAIGKETLTKLNDNVEAMVHLAQVHGVPAMAVSIEDHHHVYYQNEDYFNVEEPRFESIFKDNHIALNVRYVVEHVVQLVKDVTPHLILQISLNVNFPSMNDIKSSCHTQGKSGPSFFQVVRRNSATGVLGKVVAVPQFFVTSEDIVPRGTKYFLVSEELKVPKTLSELDVMRLLHLFSEETKHTMTDNDGLNLSLSNKEEYRALSECRIVVGVNHITRGNNLDTSFMDVSLYLS